MTENYNPFNEGVAGDFFVGRERQLASIERVLAGLMRRRPNHLYIAGTHGSGKTSLLAKTSDLARDSGCIAVACTVDAPATPRAQVNAIMRAIVQATDDFRDTIGKSTMNLTSDFQRKGGPFKSQTGDRLHADDLLSDLRLVERQLKATGSPPVLITLDEGQRIDPYALSALKNAFQHLRSYLLVLSLRIEPTLAPAANAGRAMLERLSEAAEGDRGAGRLFVVGLEVGPFETRREAAEAISTRLRDNEISFDSDVLEDIADASARMPRDAISLAAAVYEQAAADGVTLAGPTQFQNAFIRESPDSYERARTFLTLLSPTERQAVIALASFEEPAPPEQIVRKAYPAVDPDQVGSLVEGVAAVMQRLRRENGKMISATREKSYLIAGSRQRFALLLAQRK